MNNYLFRVANSRGKVVLETPLYGVSAEEVTGMLWGLSFGYKAAKSGSLAYVVAYSFDAAGNVTNCRAVNNRPRNYSHPQSVTI